jgi:hypothetical protein
MIRGTNYRHIPISTRIAILFGGFKNQFGWMFFGFGMIFFWAFAMNADLSSYHFDNDVVVVQGVAMRSNATNASENEVAVYANHYSFRAEDGREYHGVSYATGIMIKEGESLTIEYPAGKPELSRIQGMRMKIFSPFVLFVVIFPFVGLVFILFGLRRSLRALMLSRYGILTTGELVSSEPTRTKINGRTVYRMTFCFKDDGGSEYSIIERTPNPQILMNQKQERLLYLRNRPSQAMMLDNLPGAVVIDDSGKIIKYPPSKALLLMLSPLASMMGHGIYYLNNYFG